MEERKVGLFKVPAFGRVADSCAKAIAPVPPKGPRLPATRDERQNEGTGEVTQQFLGDLEKKRSCFPAAVLRENTSAYL